MAWPPWPKKNEKDLAKYVCGDTAGQVRLSDAIRDDLLARGERRRLLEAIYGALLGCDIRYARENFDPSSGEQRIREPESILRGAGNATCLDLALLFAGVCLGNELLPLVVVLKGHALAAVSLVIGRRDASLPGRRDSERDGPWVDDGLLRNGDTLQRLVNRGDYLPIECTGFARSEQISATLPEGKGRVSGLMTFARAVEAGYEQLRVSGREFAFAIDVAILQDSGIHPYPLTASAGKPALTVEQVNDVFVHKDDVWSAIVELYEKRLPEDERYDNAILFDLIRSHLSGDFGARRPAAYWKAFFLIAKSGDKVVGMLLGYNYNDAQSNFLYITYLIAQKPQPNRDIGRTLIEAFIRLKRDRDDKGPQARFLADVDDPATTTDPKEKRDRQTRIKLFDLISRFAGVQLRCLDLKFIQPKLSRWKHEKQLLILFGAEAPPQLLSKSEALQIITWLYKQLYAANMFVDPADDHEYQRYLDYLLKRATEALPDSVELLSLQQIYNEGRPGFLP
jgi:hypothetical protein